MGGNEGRDGVGDVVKVICLVVLLIVTSRHIYLGGMAECRDGLLSGRGWCEGGLNGGDCKTIFGEGDALWKSVFMFLRGRGRICVINVGG